MIDMNALGDLIEARVRKVLEERAAREVPPGPEYLTIAEAAALVSKSPSTIGEWFRDKKLARYGRGRSVRVKRAELLAVMEAERERTDGKTAAEVKAIAQRLLKKGSH